MFLSGLGLCVGYVLDVVDWSVWLKLEFDKI